jgi:hypothetical protein
MHTAMILIGIYTSTARSTDEKLHVYFDEMHKSI